MQKNIILLSICYFTIATEMRFIDIKEKKKIKEGKVPLLGLGKSGSDKF